ncbi:serine/threonine-protein kinase [Streptomyces sp. TLI_171]|uniref:serine/threonine-protein kinase n=1 Tax=Streptomyces sp. TLI_171 TaxID=1938859 RepID=UPI000C17EA40|nr:serine/threonine-protein kinase [Streptomyces sp. TLI_171]RKE17190.1 serine/threonine protein kinase [Streptomyces sp. TLI_171]
MRDSDTRAIGPYRVLRELGAGGMGQVHLCRTAGGVLVAVKVLHPEYARDEAARRRFAREARAARRVGGLWTAPVVDADPDAERPWLAIAYVPAPSLAELLRTTGPLPVASVRRLGAGIAEALAAVHAAGLVHRDLKPANILVTAHGPKVIDFGISRAPGQTLTLDGVTGTPGYMSPEQIERPAQVGPPSDVFALGAVLATAAQGRHPWTAPDGGSDDIWPVLQRTVGARPDLADVPAALLPALVHCLAPDPAGRPTPRQLLALLDPDPGAAWLPPAGLALVARHAEAQHAQPETAAEGAVRPHPLIARHPEVLDLIARRAAAEQLPPAAARDALAELLPVAAELYGPDHPDALDLRLAHARATGDSGQAAQAAVLLADLVEHTARVLGPDAPAVLHQRLELVHRTARSGSLGVAIGMAARLGERIRAELAPADPLYCRVHLQLGELLSQGRQFDSAAAAYQLAADGLAEPHGEQHPDVLEARYWQAHWTYTADPRGGGAIGLFARLAVGCEAVHGPGAMETLSAREGHAYATAGAGHANRALMLYNQLVLDCTTLRGPLDELTLTARSGLAHHLGEMGAAESAADAFEELTRDCAAALGPNHPRTGAARKAWAGWNARAATAHPTADRAFAREAGPAAEALSARMRAALALADRGDPATAVTLLLDTAAQVAATLDPHHFLAFKCRLDAARLTARAGNRASALRQLDVLRAETVERFGDHSRLATLALTRRQVEDGTAAGPA